MTIRGVEPPYGRSPQHDAGRRALDSVRRTNNRSSAWPCWAQKAAEKLFGEIPPEGENITINGLQFKVVGLLKTKTQISNYNTPDNECIFIPYDTASLLRDIKYPDDIVWMPANPIFRARGRAGKCARRWRASTTSRPTTNAPLELIVFNEFMKLIDTMSIALQVLLGLDRRADAGHRRRRAGEHHAGFGDAADARNRRAEIDRRHSAARSCCSSCSRRWRSSPPADCSAC